MGMRGIFIMLGLLALVLVGLLSRSTTSDDAQTRATTAGGAAEPRSPAARLVSALGNPDNEPGLHLGASSRHAFDPPAGPAVATLDEARSGFALQMEHLQAMAEARPISKKRWDAVYREANDAYAALSMQLDARDRVQRQELEAAHKQLVRALANIPVRGGSPIRVGGGADLRVVKDTNVHAGNVE